METPFKYGNPLLFRTPIWVTLPSDDEVTILLKPLSYSMITEVQEAYHMKQTNSDFLKYETFQTAVLNSIKDTTNAINFPSFYHLVNQLSKSDLKFLYDKLQEISTISRKQLEALDDMLSIQFSPKFSEDSWNCSICQEKKLDYSRGCGFLDKDKRDPSPMLPKVNNRRFTECPISTMDPYIIGKAALCHSFFIQGMLPEDGGIGAQTEWFVRVSLLYKKKIAEAERASIDEIRNNK